MAGLIGSLRHCEPACDTARGCSLCRQAIAALRTAIDYSPARIEIDYQPAAADDVATLIKFNRSDQRNQPPVEVIDAKLAARCFRRAADENTAARIKPLHFNAARYAARIGNGNPRCIKRKIALANLNIARKNRAISPVLNFNPVGQVVGMMNDVRSTRELIESLVAGYVDAVDRLNGLAPE